MDASGSSDGTEPSSSSDSSSEGSTRMRSLPNTSENRPMNSALVFDNDDSASDISMSAETDDEEDEAPTTAAIRMNPNTQILEPSPGLATPESVAEGSNKRKYPGSMEDTTNGLPQEVRKRLKPDEVFQPYRSYEGNLPRDKSLLPAEVWHHIFTFIPPRDLGLLLSVNRSFNAYLDPSSSDPSITPLSRSVAQILKPDAIWRASRRLFRPGMPAPLSGKSELDMWKLACSSSCQFCGKRKQPDRTAPSDQWHPGPGENGVVPIWSFGIRACGPCFLQHSSKVVHDIICVLFFLFITNLAPGNRLAAVILSSVPAHGCAAVRVSYQ
jgi:hypothetical protein